MRRLAIAFVLIATVIFMSSGCSLISRTVIRSSFTSDIERLSAGTLKVESQNGSISLVGWDRDYVRIEGVSHVSGMGSEQVKEFSKSLKAIWTQSPGELNIGISHEGFTMGVSFGVSMTIYLPADLYNDYRVTTSNGPLKIEGVAGNCVLRSSNGSVSISNFEGSVNSVTSNGNYSVSSSNLYGNSYLKTSNGSVMIDLQSQPSGDLEIFTSNGRAVLSLPWTTSGRVHAKTSNGTIEVKGFQSVTFNNRSKDLVDAQLNRGTGLNLTVRTSNGSITLNGD